jgi:hypothetical protein
VVELDAWRVDTCAPSEGRALAVLLIPTLEEAGFESFEEGNRDVLAVRDAVGGNIVERRAVLVVLGGNMLALDRDGMGCAGFLAAGGVPVRVDWALDKPLLVICFVGDFTGDRIPLVPLRAPGVGLPLNILVRLLGSSV